MELAEKQNTQALLDSLGLSRQYKTQVNRLLQYGAVTYQTIRKAAADFREQVKTGAAAAASYNLFVNACRRLASAAALRIGGETGVVAAKQELAGLKLIRLETAPVYLLAEELELVKSVAGERTKLIMELLQRTGLRVSEAAGLTVKSLKKTNGCYTAKVIGKGEQERSVFIAADLMADLQRVFAGKVFLLETQNGKQYSRVQVYRMVRQAAAKAARVYADTLADRAAVVSHCTPHTLRHSFATAALESGGADLYSVSQYLGHSTVQTTSKYYLHHKPQASTMLAVFGVYH